MRRRWQPILSPGERLSEVMFGLIMALSITGSLSVAESGRSAVRTMLVGAIGCNTAWGFVDAMMYLLSLLTERYRTRALFRAVRNEQDSRRAQEMIADRLPPLLADGIGEAELEGLWRQVVGMTTAPAAGLTGRDLLGALGVFFLVFLSTLPVALPFLLPIEPLRALRLSNGVAVAMLFGLGYRLGRYVAGPPILIGLVAVLVGAVLVAVTIALGG